MIIHEAARRGAKNFSFRVSSYFLVDAFLKERRK
jgi:hypothetical protein